MKGIRYFLTLCIAALSVMTASAQYYGAYDRYIDRYWGMAVEQMQKYHVPASITLAQGLIETRAGQSKLATQANTHFGIKCSHGWTGPYILADDDKPNEKFRSYKSARESFEDHSRFLLDNPRYRFLFDLNPTDYRGWAYGLKRAGYATNPAYADMLINVIENYNLARFDGASRDINPHRLERLEQKSEHTVYFNNNNYYIIARDGDTYKSIKKETGVSKRKILKYNELPAQHELAAGDILYLERKQKHASREYKDKLIVVKSGDSYYSIAQRFGIRLKDLYKMNCLPPDAEIQEGQMLFVYR